MLLQFNTLSILENVQNRPKPRSKHRVGRNIPESSSSNQFDITLNENKNIFATFIEQQAERQAVVLNADGPGDTYELITSVFAPGNNPVETPDCNHADFGRHIEEVYDEVLSKNVFKFHIHELQITTDVLILIVNEMK